LPGSYFLIGKRAGVVKEKLHIVRIWQKNTVKVKAPRSRAAGVSGQRNNLYFIATSCGELDPKKDLSVWVWLIND
jgi:hypothetical protein